MNPLEFHKKHGGKIEVRPKKPPEDRTDLSIQYTPGVARVSEEIARDPEKAYSYTIKRNTVAVVTDGSAVLGLGNIGPLAALPVMEGKAVLFKRFGGVDAFPICLDTQDPEEIISTVRRIAPSFGGINLEDISAPRCFYIEEKLQDLGIPVFHDDQHGTAMVVLAALINAHRILGRDMGESRVVISGAGAAGIAIARMLLEAPRYDPTGTIQPPRDIILCDSKGIINRDRRDLNPYKEKIAQETNRDNLSGTLADAMKRADVFIGVSRGGIVSREMVKSMNPEPVVLAMANPVPEIMPEEAKKAGAAIVGTGRSDYPNQVNNLLAFPGVFRGALDARAPRITRKMMVAGALAIANSVDPSPDSILPDPLDKRVHENVALAVREAAGE